MGRRNKNTPRYEIREWYGKYSKWMLIMKGGELLKWHSRTLDRFFAMYPKYRGLEQFTSVDVADYKLVRLRAGMTELTVEKEISYIHLFWQWLVIDKELPLHSIVRAFKNRGKWRGTFKAKGKLTLEQATHIMENCEDVRSKCHVLHIIKGGGCNVRPRWLLDDIYNAAEKAGVVEFRLRQLKMRASNRLAQDIIKAYCDKILDTLTPKAELPRDTFATVEVPTLDERPPVLDSNNNKLSISRILEQQLGAEG